MFSRFQKKLTETKNYISNKIDHLEVEKNQIFNKTYREIKSQLALNGVDYFLKKEESLLDIQSIAKDNHENAREADKAVKNCLLRTTNFYHSLKLLEKEFSGVVKLLNSFQTIINNIETSSILLEKEMDEMDQVYNELIIKQKMDSELEIDKEKDEAKDNEKIDSLLSEDNITLGEKDFKLSLALDN